MPQGCRSLRGWQPLSFIHSSTHPFIHPHACRWLAAHKTLTEITQGQRKPRQQTTVSHSQVTRTLQSPSKTCLRLTLCRKALSNSFPSPGQGRQGWERWGAAGGRHLTSSWNRPRVRVGVGSRGFWTQRVGVVLDGQATCSPEKATGPRGSQPLRVPQGQAEGRGGRGIKCNPAP